jgi:ATP-binding cassette, subfamily B, bacterial
MAAISAGPLPEARRPEAEPVDEIRPGEALRLIGRAFHYMAPFKWRFLAKWVFALGALLPVIIIPVPLQIIADHVIQALPITERTLARNPAPIAWLVGLLQGMDPWQIMLWVSLAGAAMVLLVGAFGREPAANDETSVDMAEGHDNATRTENEANVARSASGGVYGWIEFRWQLRLSQALNHYYRAQLFERIKSLPMVTLENQRIGDAIYRVMYDTPMITKLCYGLVVTPTLAIGTFLITAYLMSYRLSDVNIVVFGQDFGMAAIAGMAALTVPLHFLATLPFARPARRRNLASRSAGAQTTGTIEEGMSNILAVQSLGGWRRERARFERASRESFRGFRRVAALSAMIRATLLLLGRGLGVLASLLFVGMVIEGMISIGELSVVTYYYTAMVVSASSLARFWIDLQDNVVGVRRVFWLMDQPAETDEGTRTLPRIQQGVSIQDAALVYPDGRRALDGVSLEARLGQVIAIVGPTGAGKTSLAYLIPRFHKATRGTVRIDGVDVNDVRLDSLRSQISYVFQETHLFSGTVAENIGYAQPGAGMQEIERAARHAGAHAFIAQLPQGYATSLGQRGSKLSVGQKQRIAIARGLLRESPILILDEPTSALDPETETYLVQSLREAARSRLVIIIAHRLSTIAHADTILFMEQGRIRERGSHRELMADPRSAYRRYVELQTRGRPAAFA